MNKQTSGHLLLFVARLWQENGLSTLKKYFPATFVGLNRLNSTVGADWWVKMSEFKKKNSNEPVYTLCENTSSPYLSLLTVFIPVLCRSHERFPWNNMPSGTQVNSNRFFPIKFIFMWAIENYRLTYLSKCDFVQNTRFCSFRVLGLSCHLFVRKWLFRYLLHGWKNLSFSVS